MLGLGFLFLVLGGISTLTGIVMVLVGAVEENKRKMKRGAYILLGGALGLLVSFSLCSTAFDK